LTDLTVDLRQPVRPPGFAVSVSFGIAPGRSLIECPLSTLLFPRLLKC